MSLSIHQIAVGGYDNNFSYIVADTDTTEALIVDPSGNLELILEVIEEQEYSPAGILITHTHPDHVDQLAELLRSYLLPIYVHEAGAGAIISPGPITLINEGDTIPLGDNQIQVMYTPGHCDDAVCYYIEKEQSATNSPQVITGDTLFIEGCGRTNEQRVKDLYESLQELKALPEDTIIYPGHDYGPTPTSTIGTEKANNRFLKAKSFNEFHKERLG